MDELATALTDSLLLLLYVGRLTAQAAWDLVAPHPQLQAVLAAATAAFGLYWFADGVRNWQRKCLRCRGRGGFGSRLSKRLRRPCPCCGGTGVHTTVRKRLAGKLRGTKA